MIKKILRGLMLLILIIALTGSVLFAYFSYTVTDQLPKDNISLTSVFYYSDGSVLDTRFQENRYLVELEDIPITLQQATIAIEDKNFYNHFGLDIKGLFRAAYVNITHGQVMQGGSTISQQLAKNLFLSHERTFARKLEEAVMALQLERRYSKEEILQKYLNVIYYGHGQYGVEAASRYYFGKSVKDLTLSEAALLAGLPQSPYYLSPFVDLQASLARQETVLSAMVEEGYISAQEKEAALQQPLEFREKGVNNKREKVGAYFVDHLLQSVMKDLLEDDPQLLSRGVKIYTTLDKQMQMAAEQATDKIPQCYVDEKGVSQPQGALIAIEPATGYVRAMVGGRSYNETNFNRATQASRSPGSSFKPFLYAAALENGYTADTRVNCEEVEFALPGGDVYKPTDFSGGYHWKPLTVREAIRKSCNVVAVKINADLGPELAAEYANKMGSFSSEIKPILSLPLGSNEVTLLEMVTGYIPLANGGITSTPIFITKIEDAKGRVIFSQEEKHTVAIDPRTAYILTDILKDVLGPEGTASNIGENLGRPAAAKTGTAENFKNAYIVGYTPDIVVGAYVGDDHNKSLGNVSSVIVGPFWRDFFINALHDLPPRDFTRPDGIVEVTICAETGLLQNPNCPGAGYQELFIAGTEPQQQCRCRPQEPTAPWWWWNW